MPEARKVKPGDPLRFPARVFNTMVDLTRNGLRRGAHPMKGPAQRVYVALESDGGSNGNASTQASYTYTATDLDTDEEYGTTLSPASGRSNGIVTQATIGAGYFDANGEFVLVEAFENPGTIPGNECPP